MTFFYLGEVAFSQIASFPIEEYISYLTQLHQFEIKVANSKGFVAEDYFDVTKNSWDLSKISEGIKKGQRLCLLGST